MGGKQLKWGACKKKGICLMHSDAAYKKNDNSAGLQGIMHDQACRPSHFPLETFQSVIEMFDI